MTAPMDTREGLLEFNSKSERLLFEAADKAYFKASETSDPQHWMEAALLARQHRVALTKLNGVAQAAPKPSDKAASDEAYRLFPDEVEPVNYHPAGKIVVDRGNLRFAFITGATWASTTLPAPTQASPEAALADAAVHILNTFRKDEADGFRSRDRQFAITILEKALALSSTDGGSPPSVALEALTQAKAALIKIRAASIAGCEEGYGKPEKWADALFASHADVHAAIKSIDAALTLPQPGGAVAGTDHSPIENVDGNQSRGGTA